MIDAKHISERERKIVSLVNKCSPANKVVADLGAGPHRLLNDVQCEKKITVDFNPENHPDMVCDLNKQISLPSNSIDICVAAEVLEHIYYSIHFIQEIARILKANGHLIIAVPNICSLSCRLKFLLGQIPQWAARADLTYEQYGVVGVDGGHVRDYNFRELETLLTQNGFSVIERTYADMPYTRKLKVAFLDKFLPMTFAEKVVLRAQKN